jgi:transcriptional regulator with XRE-family HTH domain
MRVEVRATRLKALREARGLTQRRLAHDLGISQNYIPAIEAGARRAGPKLQDQLTKYFRVPFEEIFDVVLIDPDTKRERQLGPAEARPRAL